MSTPKIKVGRCEMGEQDNGRAALTPRLIGLLFILPALLFLGLTWQKTQPPTKTNLFLGGDLAGVSAPCSLALARGSGSTAIDEKISRLQQEIREAAEPLPRLEQLGWLFVKKARLSFDPGVYKLAEACAACIELRKSGTPEALLLRAYVLQSLHRFSEAEPLARQLVSRRGLAFDYGVLGDVLIDEGKTAEAVAAYQQMIDTRPDLQSYTRAAHIRWLKGDLRGAIDLMKLAAGASSPADPESAAWAYTRLAVYQLQAGEPKKSLEASAAALSFQSDYAPALLAKGKTMLSVDRFSGAITALTRAADLNPLPEYLWTLADALRAAGKTSEANIIDQQLRNTGGRDDPRTFALYLATRGADGDTAVRLAEDELKIRGDIHTHDAFSWTLLVAGRAKEAESHMAQALSEGTQDARLFLHAAVIATELGQKHVSRRWLMKAYQLRQMLLPSERELLKNYLPIKNKGTRQQEPSQGS